VLERIFRTLLRLFPHDFQEDFGREMEQVFCLQKSDGPRAWMMAFAAMIAAAPREHWDSFRRDSRITFRSMRTHPGFSAVATLTIALGIGATAGIFSVVDAVLLKPVPYPDSARLVRIRPMWRGFGPGSTSIPELLDIQQDSRSFESMSAYVAHDINISVGNGEPERIQIAQSTAGLFDVLRVKPLLGRTLENTDHETGNDRVIVISFGLWQRRFGGDPSIIGREVRFEGEAFRVVGVMPRGFYFPEKQTDVWAPVVIRPQDRLARGAHSRTIVARLKDGTDPDAARRDVASVGLRMTAANPQNYPQDGSFALQSVSLHDLVAGNTRSPLLLLLCASGFLLLIATVNVASLTLARSSTRETELAIRTALGARSGRLKRQLMTESFWLSGIGGVIGLMFARLCLTQARLLESGAVPRIDEAVIDGRVLLVTFGLTVLTAALFGVAPVRRLNGRDLMSCLRAGVRSSGSRHVARTRQTLVVLQIALAAILLAGAGLTLRSLSRLLQVDPGIVARDVSTARITLGGKYAQPVQRVQFFTSLFESLRGVSGISAVGAVSVVPLSGDTEDWAFTVENYVPPDGNNIVTEQTRFVAGDFFATLEIPILAGRAFEPTDNADGPRVAVVSQSLARKYWNGADPIGKRLKLFTARNDSPWIAVVGVVRDIRHLRLDSEPQPMIYYPFAQYTRNGMAIVVKSQNSAATPAAIRNAVSSLDAEQPVYAVKTMDDYAADSISSFRFTSFVLTSIGALALVIATVGVYGLMAFFVSQRRHEFGVRLALGARRAQIVREIIRQGLVMSLAGVAIGIPGASWATGFLQENLYDVKAADPLAFASVGFILLLVACLVCVVPALRATRVDPALALKSE
jgi:putative ABC transport system permease protein